MITNYFYHSSIKRTISVFGTLFNNISIRHWDKNGKVINTIKVPIAYGPRQKHIAIAMERMELQENKKKAITLPRMSFEISSLNYNSQLSVNKLNKMMLPDQDEERVKKYVYGPTVYDMGIELSIMGKNQEDVLQILEQILPWFKPSFSVTISELPDNIDLTTDVPITLTGVNPSYTYEGQLADNNLIVYTLSFETKVRFYGDIRGRGVITSVETNIDDIYDNKEYVDMNMKPNSDDLGKNGLPKGHYAEGWDFFRVETDIVEKG